MPGRCAFRHAGQPQHHEPNLPVVAAAGTCSDSAASANLLLNPSPAVELTATSGAFTGAGIRYFYSISGPAFDADSNETVAGTLTTSMSASGFGLFAVGATLTGSGLDITADNAVCLSTIGGCGSEYSTSLTGKVLNLNFSSSGEIDLATVAYVIGGSATASVDPVIQLPTGYTVTVTVSDGLGNSFALAAIPSRVRMR